MSEIEHLAHQVTAPAVAVEVEAHPAVSRVQSIVSLDPRISTSQYQLMYGDPTRIGDVYARLATDATVRRAGRYFVCFRVSFLAIASSATSCADHFLRDAP